MKLECSVEEFKQLLKTIELKEKAVAGTTDFNKNKNFYLTPKDIQDIAEVNLEKLRTKLT